jgi:hypothetical protein
MKKLKLIIGVLAVMLMGGLTSCKDQTDWIPINIGFKPYIGHDTRAVVESVPFPEDRSFNVWAFDESAQSVYIDGEQISHSTNGWVSSKIWPRKQLSFEACWPADVVGATYTPEKGICIRDFDTEESEVDILFAKADHIDYNSDKFVTLSFEHILSRVEFRMRQSLSDEMSVRVNRIELQGFATKGDFNTSGNYQWKTSGPVCSYVFDTSDSPIDVNSEPIYMGEDFYTIPQLLEATLIVNFEVKYGQASWIPLQEEIRNFLIEWLPGTHYTYTLNLTETNLTYTTGISNWNNRVE